MHWVLDVTFREDDSRTRERTLGNNLSWLRRFAVPMTGFLDRVCLTLPAKTHSDRRGSNWRAASRFLY